MLFRMLKYDLLHGTVAQWKRFVILGAVIIFSCVMFVVNYQKPLGLSQVNFSDLILWNFRGMKSIDNIKSLFITSNGLWLMINLFLAVLVSTYTKNEMSGIGQILMIKSGKKSLWWLSKSLWCLFTVTFFYIVIIAAILLFSLFTGDIKAPVQLPVLHKLVNQYIGENISNVMLSKYILQMIIVSMAISIFQMMISIIWPVVFSFLPVGIILVEGIFTTNQYSIGNTLMLIRDINWNIDIRNNVTICSFLILMTVFVGGIYLKKKDIT